MTVIPLFPLNNVVFPGQRLPLHIFEERYRQLVREVMDSDTEFGIVLIRRGQEVGGGAVPFDTGCAVRIISADELPDGRFNIACEGTRRIKVVDLLNEEPFLRAEVEFPRVPEDDDLPHTRELADKVVQQYTDFLHLTLAMQDSWQRRFRLPPQPHALVDHVAGQIDASVRRRQQVLQADRVAARLELLLTILQGENSTLAEQLVIQRRQKLAGLGALN